MLSRVLREARDLRDAGFGVARGLVAVGFVVVVLLAGLRYTTDDDAKNAVTIKAPSFVPATAIAPPEPTTESSGLPVGPTGRETEARSWYLRWEPDTRQQFSPISRTAQALCADLAASGFLEAAWGDSAVFKGEWECASPNAEAGGVFMVARGRDSEMATSIMLKLNAASDAAQAPFRTLTEAVLARFAFSAGVEPDLEITARLSAWQPGVFAHGFQTLRIVREHGRSVSNVVNLSVLPLLPLAAECGPNCFPLKPQGFDEVRARTPDGE